jgi:hypothetical protein
MENVQTSEHSNIQVSKHSDIQMLKLLNALGGKLPSSLMKLTNDYHDRIL